MFINILIFLIAGLVLVKSSAILVKALVNIARFLKWSEFVVSFVLVGIATTLPEFFVGISSALRGAPELSLGNVIGSNIVNLTLVAGLIILFSKSVKVQERVIKRDIWIVFGLAILPIIFLLNKALSRLEGLILLGLFVSYLVYLIKHKKDFSGVLNRFNNIKTFLKSILFFAGSLVFLLACSWLIVYSVQEIASGLNANLIIMGILLVAFSTSLPELIFGLKSSLMHHEQMHIGNLIGATAANSALILGVTALISPIKLQSLNSFLLPAIFMIFVLLIFNLFIRTKQKLSWHEGALLVLIYVIFVIMQVF